MKKTKLLALLLALCLVISSFAVIGLADDAEAGTESVLGDADGNGVTDAFDLVKMRQFLANLDYDIGYSTVSINMSADMNGDTWITGYDLYLLRNYLVNENNNSGIYSEGFKYFSYENGNCRIEGIGNCKDTDLVIPATSPCGEKVVDISKNAFKDCSDIVSVVLPDGIKEVGMNAFENCANLTRIYIPKSVTYVGSNAFAGCHTDLTVYCEAEEEQSKTWGVNWSNGVQFVVWGFKKSSSGLEYTSNGNGTCYVSGIGTCTDKEVVIATFSPAGDSVTGIGDDAFSKNDITGIYIPASVTTVGDAFEYCEALVRVEFAKDSELNRIYACAFQGCSSLESIVIPEGTEHIGDYAFYGCTSLKSIVIPTGSISIGNWAFKGCANLESVIIPESVTIVGSDAFANCDNLTIYCEADSVPNTWSGSWNSTNCDVVWGYAPEEG